MPQVPKPLEFHKSYRRSPAALAMATALPRGTILIQQFSYLCDDPALELLAPLALRINPRLVQHPEVHEGSEVIQIVVEHILPLVPRAGVKTVLAATGTTVGHSAKSTANVLDHGLIDLAVVYGPG